MNILLYFSRRIDWITEKIGKSVGWLLLAAVLISAGNALIRKAFGVSSNAFLEAQWYLFGAVFMLGAGYVFLHDQHVRIDVASSRISRRKQIWIDVVGIALFLLPLCCFVVWTSLPSLQTAIMSKEVSANPGGLLRWGVFWITYSSMKTCGYAAASILRDTGMKITRPSIFQNRQDACSTTKLTGKMPVPQ